MRTFKKITFLTLTLIATSLVFGQPSKGNKPSKEKIKAMKIGYITEKLDLTSKEAQQFWPIYNEFDAKMEEIHKTLRSMRKRDGGIDEMADTDVEKMITTHDELRQKELNIHKEYHAKFKAVLPIKKVAKLYKANHDFKRDLLKKIKNHKGGGHKGERGPPGGKH
jgi:Spy/CpxP family protein refolding chaperone